MAACGSMRLLFENPLPENPTLIQSWNHHRPTKPMEVSSFAEIFGELYFQEPESPATVVPVPATTPPLAPPALDQAPQSNISESDSKDVQPCENPPPLDGYKCGFSYKSCESLQFCTEGLGSESSDDVDDLMDSGDDWRSCGKGKREIGRRFGLMYSGGGSNGYSKRCWSSKSVREFPPPISSMGKSGKPCVCLKSYREGGRFVLREIRIPTQELLRASREDGRLKLHFVHPDEDITEEDDEEEEELEEDDEKKVSEGENRQ